MFSCLTAACSELFQPWFAASGELANDLRRNKFHLDSRHSQTAICGLKFARNESSLQRHRGTATSNYVILVSTNLTLPLANWTPLRTNQFDANGQFRYTNSVSAVKPRQFYLQAALKF